MRTTARFPRVAPAFALVLALATACDETDDTGDDAMAEGSGGDEHGSTADDHGTMEHGTMDAMCDVEDRDDDFALGLAHEGASMQFAIADADPAMPIRGDNAWTIAITDASGAPMDGMAVSVRPWMPDHGHGTPVQAQITALEDGQYEIAPLNLFMAEDSVVFKVCVE
jgi:hypothetical protein